MTDGDFVLTERTCALAITADVSFKATLAADFKKEFKNIDFLWKQSPGVGRMIALSLFVRKTGKKLVFFGN